MKLFNTLLFTLILLVTLYIINKSITHTSIENFVTVDEIKDGTGVKSWSDWDIKYGEKLINKGVNPDTSKNKLGKCEGDCDNDSDCKPGLKCFQRNGKTPVPGCIAGGPGDKTDYDYCYDPNDKLPSCNNYLNMTNSTSIDVTNTKYGKIDEKNLGDINNVRKVLYGNNKENLNKDEYTLCNLNLCVGDDGLPNKKEIRDYDIKIKNYFEKIQGLEELKAKINVLIVNSYIPFLQQLLLLLGQMILDKNLKVTNKEIDSVNNKIELVFTKSKETFLDKFNDWINNHSQNIFLREKISNIKVKITNRANNISDTIAKETKLLSLSILDYPSSDRIRNKLSDTTWNQKLTQSSNIYSDFKSFFLVDYFNEISLELDILRNKTKTEMNRLKQCESNGRIIGTPITDVNGGQCKLDGNPTMEQKISSCNKICISQTDCNYYTLDGNRCSLYKHLGEIVPSTDSRSFKSIKGCTRDKWTVKTLVNSYSGNRKNKPDNQVMIEMDGPIGQNSSGTYDFSYAFWIYINSDFTRWRGILRRGPNYPFYSPGKTYSWNKQRQPGIWIFPGRSNGEFNRSSETNPYHNGRSLHFRFGLKGANNWNRGIDVPAWKDNIDIIKPKTWHHVVFTVKDSKEFSAYIDGYRRAHTIVRDNIATELNDNFPITMGVGNEGESLDGYIKFNNDSSAPGDKPGFIVRNVQVFRNTLDQNYINSLMKSDLQRGVTDELYEQFDNYSEVKTALDVRNPQNLYRLPLVNKGNNPDTSENKLDRCEGDCDSDSDCKPGLKCFQRSSSNDVPPGCKPGGPGDDPTHDYCYDPDPTKLMNKQHKLWGVGKTEKILAKAALEGKTISSNSSLHECNTPSNQVDMIYINTPKTFKDAKAYCKKIGRNLLKFVHPEGDGEGRCGGKTNCNKHEGIEKANRINGFKYYQAIDLLNKGKLVGRSKNDIWVDGTDADFNKPNSSAKINREGTFINDNLTLTHIAKYNKTGGNTVTDGNSVSYWNGNEPNDWGNNEDCIQMSPMWASPENGLKMNDINCKTKKPFICEKELIDPINLSTNVCKDNLKLQNFEKRMGLDPMSTRAEKCQQFSNRYGVKHGLSWGCIEKNDWAKSWWSGKHSEGHNRGKPITYEEGCTTTTDLSIDENDGCHPSSPYYLGLKIREGKDNKWNPDTTVNKLGVCEGDCDSDSDCKPGLKCFQRSGNTSVPGCTTVGYGNWKDADYCIHDYDRKI